MCPVCQLRVCVMSVEPWRCASCFFFLSGRSTHTYLEPTGRRALFRQRASSFFPFFFSPLSCFLDRAQPAAASTPSGFCRAAKEERRRRGPAAALQSLTSDLLVLLSGAPWSAQFAVAGSRRPRHLAAGRATAPPSRSRHRQRCQRSSLRADQTRGSGAPARLARQETLALIRVRQS